MGLIAVVGSLNMDLLITTDRLPSKGETVSGTNLQYLPGGKGANQAVAAAKLGGKVEMFGCVGRDSSGKDLLRNFDQIDVGRGHVKVLDGIPTGTAFITVGNGDNTIVVVAGANDYVDKAYIDSVKGELLKADIIVLQQEIPQETNEYIAWFGREHGKTVILDPAPARAVSGHLLAWIDYLIPNEHEASLIFGHDIDSVDLMRKYPGKLIITRGDQGVSFCSLDGTVSQLPAAACEVVDTTGAGDTLAGAFAFMLANQQTVIEALRFANFAAGCTVEQFGAQTGMPSFEQVMAKMRKDLRMEEK